MTVSNLNLLCAAIGAGLALLVGRHASFFGRILGLLDFPDPAGGRKRHQTVTPLVGGVAMLCAFEIAAGLLIAFLNTDSPDLDWHVGWAALVVGTMAVIGLADDRFSLSPVLRLSVTFTVLALASFVAPDFRVEFLRFAGVDSLIVLPTAIGICFTLLCQIGLLNAVNMADGKNGLVITMALIWTAVLFAQNPRPFDPLLFAVAASLGVLLIFNLQGKLFLGDSGSYGISAIFGLLSIYAYNHSFATFGAEQVAIMFLVPVLDTVRLMTWRLRHGRSPFAGDRNHLHHYLAARWQWPTGLVIYAAIVAIPNMLAVAFPEYSPAWVALTILLYVGTLRLAAQRGTFRQGFST
jgi:UDP-GlcNAc:undecaprenyl-phosphate GlcNAc-1-phosphate transferase